MRSIEVRDGSDGRIEDLFTAKIRAKPVPGPGEALIRVKAFGVNPMDAQQRRGQYPLPLPAQGRTMGVEFSGIVESLELDHEDGGKNEFRPGDEVFGLTYGGAYAEWVLVNTKMLIRKPAKLSWEICASVPETWFTALQALFAVGCFTRGMSILWHCGASNVSIAGIQLAKASGSSKILVTTGSQHKIDYCKSLGADTGFLYRSDPAVAVDVDWADEVLHATDGKGVDLIIDFVGGSYLSQNLRAVAGGGRIVCLGIIGGRLVVPAEGEEGVDFSRLIAKQVRIEGSLLRTREIAYQAQLVDLFIKHVLASLEEGVFQHPIHQIFAWERIQDAHKAIEVKQGIGKIVCTIE